jgi:hypothetical protein
MFAADHSLSPREAVQTSEFVLLWCTVLMCQQAIGFGHTTCRVLQPQTFKFLDNGWMMSIGIVGALLNSVGRVAAARLADRYSYKVSQLPSSQKRERDLFLGPVLSPGLGKRWGMPCKIP